MGKKNLNPADAFREYTPPLHQNITHLNSRQGAAQERAQKGTNKAERSKTRDFALVKKDTTDLEIAIKEFEDSRADPAKLAELKAELEKINRKKAEYVEEHPEQRRLVYRRRKEGEPEPDLPSKKRNLFLKNGLPRHPERSIYYDPTMNPFGVAPPGMPYVERPLLPGEVDSDAEMDQDDDDIPLPPGLPPGTEEVQSDDDIPMPDGPPPGQEDESHLLSNIGMLPPPGFPPNGPDSFLPPPPPIPPPGFQIPTAGVPPPPPPPPGFAMGSPTPYPLPPPGTSWPPVPPVPMGWNSVMPPPPPGFPSYPNTYFPPFPPNAFPPPPPKFLPRQQSTSAMQDPLSSVPHQTFQAHRASQLAPPHPSLPPNPAQTGQTQPLPASSSLPAKPTTAAEMAAATVFSAPQLRDFKKEATAFVPTAVKRKKAPIAAESSSSKINAAPSLGSSAPSVDAGEDGTVEVGPARPDLVNALKSQFGAPTAKATVAAKAEPNPKSDYDKFVEEMGDILGTK